MGEPLVQGIPATSAVSFTAIGNPCNAPSGAPEARSASAAAASARRSSPGRMATIALIRGL
eukprot:4505403-Pleurochrysis_carterae.AAC.2